MNTKESIVAAIYPYSKGYGYALFQGDGKYLDSDNQIIRPADNGKCLERIRSFLGQSRPNILILRNESKKGFRGSQRTSSLLADIRRIAQDHDICVVDYSRKDMSESFASFGISNKEGIADKICEWFPVLVEHLPPRRRTWDAQHYRMGRFDAIALAYTHLHITHSSGFIYD